MKNKHPYLTAGELAKIHGLNKRTLHYYDEAGIFSLSAKEKMDTVTIRLNKAWNWSIFLPCEN